ncbi:threonylcarbamoyl-AMP synthase [Nitrosopumilus sp. b1]|uniref:L-threonylcarbamoyladenylate synthase n=1 Tax=Nitrosopumilus sp. b1 TaxID=2109907 RepID=UPI0015F5817B|nr:L-threonylcarbamoyladenylate synthase [Nitrosopumilus sp. b1]KAF6242129.1 threonylcarbamoyl-AMP synthase [Nitrosopumilus sp. b1]
MSKTKIIKINPKNPQINKIRQAALIIKNGGTVAFPTETVYGLGANALNAKAVKKIFKAKKRPADNPLIVHINKYDDLRILTDKIPPLTKKITRKYWPGPLTILVKKSKNVPDPTTGGQKTVAVRMPSNKIARLLIKESGVPVAAPSANLFGKPSPTSAKHVIDDLYGRVDAIVDGGTTDIGLESTVLDITKKVPILLRPGKITKENLRGIIKIKLDQSLTGKRTKISKPRSPGMKYKHYTPNARVILLKNSIKNVDQRISELVQIYQNKKKRVGIVTTQKNKKYKSNLTLFLGKDPKKIAKNLFSVFRKFDSQKIDILLIQEIADNDLGFAIMNRLNKAAYQVITK